jgi:hypothetical protein
MGSVHLQSGPHTEVNVYLHERLRCLHALLAYAPTHMCCKQHRTNRISASPDALATSASCSSKQCNMLSASCGAALPQQQHGYSRRKAARLRLQQLRQGLTTTELRLGGQLL